MIDLRSDTVTKPTPEMRAAIANAEVGDDVLRDDPTVNALEEYCAKLCGKEAALLVPTGTMGNLVCVLTHCNRGDEIIIGAESHLCLYERGSTAALASVHPRQIPNEADGTMNLASIKSAIRKVDVHFPTTKLICIEQTHNRCGGRVLPLSYIDELASLAHSNNVLVHMDGARLMNACVSLGVTPEQMLRNVDSCTFCLSKGLGAPVGSVIVGTRAFIEDARRWRKCCGGGMRQAGVLAAAGIYALEHQYSRLADDHQNAQLFRDCIAKHCEKLVHAKSGKPFVSFRPVESNIVIMETAEPVVEQVIAQAKTHGILLSMMADVLLRGVTHLHITREHAEQAGDLVGKLLCDASSPFCM
jgi:threonine aldolase